jgi:hypothetical protein
MIVATVRLTEPPGNRFIDESPINVWLLANVGKHSPYKDNVSEKHPWYVEHGFRYLTYHFAREQDALLFSLRWAR